VGGGFSLPLPVKHRRDMGITPITLYALPNEKAWTYLEMQEQSPFNKGFHRYRIIGVLRDGRVAEYREDMGSAKNFVGAKQLHIPSLWEHTVAELINLADGLRWDTDIDVKDLLELDDFVPA